MQTDYLQFVFQAIRQLLTDNLGFFDAMGQNLFRIVRHHPDRLVRRQVGARRRGRTKSFPVRQLREPPAHHQLRFRHGELLQHSHSRASARAFMAWSPTKRSFFRARSTRPSSRPSSRRSPTLKSAWIRPPGEIFSAPPSTSSSIILLAAAQAVSIVVIAYGFIATAVCVLVGPIFVPFFIVPKLEWLFWGWFRCFLQYAFYQVIAAAVVFVIGNLIVGALRLPPAGALSTVQLLAWFPVLFITFLASIYVLLKVPSLTNHIFSGTAGGSSAVLLEAPAAAARQGVLMNRDASFENAKRLYLESCGDPMVTNTYLKIALALLALVCVALALIDLRTIRTFENFRPLVIRIDDLGRAEAINYHNLEYQPQDAEAKYFLSEFCALYYRRNRYTIQDDFAKALCTSSTASSPTGSSMRTGRTTSIRKFLTNSAPRRKSIST